MAFTRMLATDVTTGDFIEVDCVGTLRFEELTIEVGRDEVGNFYTDTWDEATGGRFPSGPHPSAVEAFEALIASYRHFMSLDAA